VEKLSRLHDTACYRRCGSIAPMLSRLDACENWKVVRWCRTQASSHNSQGVVDGGVNAAGMSTAAPDRSVVRSFDWLVSRIFKWNQIVAMALWNCFSENICLFVCLQKRKRRLALRTKLWTFVRVRLPVAWNKYIPTLLQHIHLYSLILHKKQGTNKYVYKLLQSFKSLNTLKYYYINTLEG